MDNNDAKEVLLASTPSISSLEAGSTTIVSLAEPTPLWKHVWDEVK
jgi:hypothetical protein